MPALPGVLSATQPPTDRSVQMGQLVIELALRAFATSAAIGALFTAALIILF